MNLAILIGRLGGEPETRYTQDGKSVTSFTLATSKKSQGKEYTEWHRIVTWGKTAENCGQYLAKGSQVSVRGEIRTRQWERDGQKHYTTEIHAMEVEFLGSKGGNQGSKGPDSSAGPDDLAGGDIPF